MTTCQNDGVCFNLVDGFFCQCIETAGTFCEITGEDKELLCQAYDIFVYLFYLFIFFCEGGTPKAPVIVNGPVSGSFRVGSRVTLTCEVSADTYSTPIPFWFFEGALVTGEFTPYLVFDAVPDRRGSYYCETRNFQGGAVSDTAFVTLSGEEGGREGGEGRRGEGKGEREEREGGWRGRGERGMEGRRERRKGGLEGGVRVGWREGGREGRVGWREGGREGRVGWREGGREGRWVRRREGVEWGRRWGRNAHNLLRKAAEVSNVWCYYCHMKMKLKH